MLGKSQRTEKFLLGTVSVLLLVLVFNFYTREPMPSVSVAAAESQDDDGGQDGGSGGDKEDDEKSSDEDSGNSANSEDEQSEPSKASAPSETSAPAAPSKKGAATNTTAVSQTSVSQQGVSVSSIEDDGQLAQESVKSLKSEDSSIATVSTEGNVSIVKRDGKLFFLIPVEIESEVATNQSGTVIMERKNFINWLKDLLST